MNNNKYLALSIIVGLMLCISSQIFSITDAGEVPAAWQTWSCWYWPWMDSLNPNLYDTNEAMERYDQLDTSASADSWEYNNHGPPQNPASWWGHCHAWAGAACWEKQPVASKVINGVTFRVRDQKGLMIEAYDNCTDTSVCDFEIWFISPGLFWSYLRNEIRGDNPMHGHGMPIIGELYYGPEVWNHPIYKFEVNYSGSSTYSGTIKIWYAEDGSPSYADDITLAYSTETYTFTGVTLDSNGNPTNSGTWGGSGPRDRPHAIWRPMQPANWTTYRGNPWLDQSYLSQILDYGSLTSGATVNSSLSAAGDTETFVIEVFPGVDPMRTILTCGSNDFDVYGKLNSPPTTNDYDWRGYTGGGEDVTFNNPGVGTWYIMVRSYSGTGSYSLTCTLNLANNNVMQNGTTVNSNLPAVNDTETWTIYVNGNTASMRTILTCVGNDFDVYGRLGAPPTTSTYDWRGYTTSGEDVTYNNPGSGTWYIMVRSYSGTGNYALTTFLTGNNQLYNDVPVYSYLSATYATETWTLALGSGVSALRTILTCGSNDFDVYGRLGSPPTTSTYDWRGYTGGGEDVIYNNPGAGTWYIMVRSYSGTGGYSLTCTEY